MEIRKSDLRALQYSLKEKGIYNGVIDGNIGTESMGAIKAYLLGNKNLLPVGFEQWPNKRKIVAAYQLILASNGHETGPIDGYFGPLTKNAGTWYVREINGDAVADFESIDPLDVNPNNFPKEKTAEMNSAYGTANPPNNCKAEIVKVHSPWKMGLDWDMTQSREHFWVHKDVAASLKRILDAVYQHYGLDGIRKHGLNRFSGDFQCRNIRGGTRPSTHAWGIAIDFYGSKNELRRITNDPVPPTLAHPELNFFWERWEEEGWYSLGRMEDRDWMHVQAAKGKKSKFYHS